MKIAVTYENGQIFQHFGHTEQFKLYEAADGKIVHAEVVDTNGRAKSGSLFQIEPCSMSISCFLTVFSIMTAIPSCFT